MRRTGNRGIEKYSFLAIKRSGIIANNTRNYIVVEEDQSFDNEREHATETVDFLTIAGSGSLSATPIDTLSANGAIPITEAISDRERLISQFEDPLFEVTTD